MTKSERDALRREMLLLGCSSDAVARELGRRWRVRPREAYRHAHGWSQDEVARQFAAVVAHREGPDVGAGPAATPARTGSGMSGTRIGEYERWPRGGRRPSVYALLVLAEVFQVPVHHLLDYQDHRALSATDRVVLAAVEEAGSSRPPAGPPVTGNRAG